MKVKASLIANRPRITGFTLIELLVVIAVIVLLLTILMSSRDRAREQARTITCRSNLKNIDLASLGIDLQNVTKLAVGIDDIGASGKLYVDDIRLYASAPEPGAP